MIKLSSSLINETIVLHPGFQQMLPDREHMGLLMDKAAENVYSAGKTWIGKQVRIALIDPNSFRNLPSLGQYSE